MKNMSDNETLIFVITCNEKRTMYSKSDSSINIAQLEGIRTVWAQNITPKNFVALTCFYWLFIAEIL